MTTLTDRPRTALVVIDVQNDVVANAYERESVIANINALVTDARTNDVPVIWVYLPPVEVLAIWTPGAARSTDVGP